MSRLVCELLRQQARQSPDQLFLWCGDAKLTFRETAHAADQVAAGLSRIGIAVGDRVAILATNRVETLELLFGCARLGAIQVPLNPRLKGAFLRHQLDDCQAATVICDEQAAPALRELLGQLPALRRAILLDTGHCDLPGLEVIPYEAVRQAEGAPPDPGLTASSLISLIYTSGTTGLPKGCMLTHGYYTHVGRVMSEFLALGPSDVLMTALPLFHAACPMMCVMAGLSAGIPVILEPEFHASEFLARAAVTGATLLLGVGAMGAALLRQPPSPADRSHRVRCAIWVPFSPELQSQFTRRFGTDVSGELYGQTECVPITFTPVSAGRRNRASSGLPAPYLEVRLVDAEDREVPAGAVGEIVVRPRAPHVMFEGYWGQPEATLAAMRNLWYHTGDLGRAEPDGSISFVDRKKDAIRRRGENVSSLELESIILACPGVAEVAVHAVAGELTEDEIKACIVPAAGVELSPAELRRFFENALPDFAIPRYVEIVSELPRNAAQRVMKHVLRARGITSATWDFQALGFDLRRVNQRRGGSRRDSGSQPVGSQD